MVTLPSWLLVGDKAMAKDKGALVRQRVRYIVNCTPPKTDGGVANYFPHDPAFEYLRVEVRCHERQPLKATRHRESPNAAAPGVAPLSALTARASPRTVARRVYREYPAIAA